MLLVTSMLGYGARAQAEPKDSPNIAPVAKGQPAPFSGVVFSPEAVAKVVAQKDAAAAAQQLAVQNQAQKDAAELKFRIAEIMTSCTADKSIIQAQLNDSKRQVNILTEQLKKNSSGPSPVVWASIGAGSALVLTLVTVFVVSQASK